MFWRMRSWSCSICWSLLLQLLGACVATCSSCVLALDDLAQGRLHLVADHLGLEVMRIDPSSRLVSAICCRSVRSSSTTSLAGSPGLASTAKR